LKEIAGSNGITDVEQVISKPTLPSIMLSTSAGVQKVRKELASKVTCSTSVIPLLPAISFNVNEI